LAMQTRRVNKSYAKGTPIKTVVEDLAKQMDLPLGTAIDNIKELSEVLSRSFAASGNPMNDVSRLLMGKQFNVSVQNQSLQLRRKTEPLQKEAIILNDKTGLITSPEIGTKGEIIVHSLLMSGFTPGRKVQIDSAMFSGSVTIQAMRFIGSTFGADWEAEMKCKLN
jgi:hypothetical protein